MRRFGDSRDTGGEGRCTMPARTRPGKDYPGGKSLRRAYRRLRLRREGEQDGKRPDRVQSRDASTPWGSYGFTAPGSMKG
jgi:hypothetical protein